MPGERANLPSSPYSHFPLALFFFEPSTLDTIDFKKALSTLTKHVRLILCQVTALGKARSGRLMEVFYQEPIRGSCLYPVIY